MIAILGKDECLEIGTGDSSTGFIHCGGDAVRSELEPYLDWSCVKLGSASLDSVGVTISPPGERK